MPLVSVIMATYNEEDNISECINSVKMQNYPSDRIEMVLVDNHSSDDTIKIARNHSVKVLIKGNKRANQLNIGVKKSKGSFLLYPDADMILSKNLIKECVESCKKDDIVGIRIPEIVIGKGILTRIRRFERKFYNNTCIDAVRFVKRDDFLRVGGFDENIEFGADDWDFDRKLQKSGKLGYVKSPIFHQEGKVGITNYLKKKGKYSETLNEYIKKWGKNDPIIRQQLGFRYMMIYVFM